MKLNSGKRFEQQWRKCARKVPELFFYRLRDGTATYYGGSQDGIRFQQSNMCDVMMFLSPLLFLLELKSTKGSSLPLKNIRKDQLSDLLESGKHKHVLAGFVVYFADKQVCYFASAATINAFKESNDRKSIPLDWFERLGRKVAVIPLKVNVDFDVGKFVTGCLRDYSALPQITEAQPQKKG